jgi:hypothetical protein
MPEPTAAGAVRPLKFRCYANDAISPDRSHSALCREGLYRSRLPQSLSVEHNTLAFDTAGIARNEPSFRTTRWQVVALVQKARAGLRGKERVGRAQNRESEQGAISQFSFQGRSLLPAATWSGYGCKPAAPFTRSASLLMTLTDIG